MVRIFCSAVVVLAALAFAGPASAAPTCPTDPSFTVASGSELELSGNCDAGATYGIVPGTGPAHGSLIGTSSSTVVYRPNLGYAGPDAFDYSATDATGTTVVHVSITVTGPTGGGGLPPQCPQSNFFVAPGATIHLVSQCTDPEGGGTHVVGFTPPTGGTFTPTGPGTADYTPFPATTSDSFTFTVSDDYSNTTTSTVHIDVVSGNGPFATAPDATPSNPFVASLSVPNGVGDGVQIAARPETAAPPVGFFLYRTAYAISAPTASQDAPLELAFTVDASRAPAGELVVFRDGQPIEDQCTGAGAYPDPCIVSQPPPVAGSDYTVVIRSMHASLWTLGVHAPYAFSGFDSPVNNLPTVNTATAGRAIPLKFGAGGDQGLDVLMAGSPSSRAVSCTSGAPTDPIETTADSLGAGLQYDATSQRYSYVWKTSTSWAGSCRKLSLRLDDGSVHEASFRFR